MQIKAWEGFKLAKWSEHGEVNVRDFIQNNYTPYDGGDEFLAPPTKATLELWQEILKLTDAERKAGGVLDADTKTVSTLTSHPAGYIDKKLEKIVGLQTDKPFKRALQPFGGIKMAEQALSMYGYEIDPEVKNIFTNYRKSHNDGVYDAYTLEMRRARRAHILTGLPDTYGRGRIVGDYRRVALYGVDYLIECKENDKTLKDGDMTPEKIRDREELSEQIKALKALKKLAEIGGKALQEVLHKIQNDALVLVPQDEHKATFCKKITAEMAKIDWNSKNIDIFNKIRALNPNPVAYTQLAGLNFKICLNK